MAKKRPPSSRRLETRGRLVDAAIAIVARDGFHGATVSAIARRAGFTTGAVYAHFSGKDELFLAVFEQHMRWFEEQVTEVTTAAEPVAAFEQGARLISQDRSQFLVFVEFWTYAVRRPALRRKFATRLAEMRAIVVRALNDRAQEGRSDIGLPPETIAMLGLALGRGLTLEKLIAPESVPDELVGQVLGGLLAE